MSFRKATKVWKDILDFEDYEVSMDALIRNKKTGRLIKNCNGPQGYQVITLYNQNGRKTLRRNRVVALAFLPNPDNKPCVNHINGDKSDDRTCNLEWVTYSQNELHSITILGKKGGSPWVGAFNEKNPNAKAVEQYTREGELITVYPSMSEAGRAGFNVSRISSVCAGRDKTHKNFVFKFSTIKTKTNAA